MAVRLEKRLAAGSFASFIGLLLGIGTAIVQVPLLLAAWGEDAYGAWLLVVATNALIVSLDLGHQNFVGNRISMLGLQDLTPCRRVLGSAVRMACVIALLEVAVAVVIACSGVFSAWLPSAHDGMPQTARQAEICLVLHTAYSAVLGSINGILVRLYYTGGLYARAQWAGIVHRLLMFLALVIAAGCGASMISSTISYLAAGALINLWVVFDVRTRFPELWPWWQSGSLACGMQQAARSLGLTATTASDQLAAAGLLGIAGSNTHGAGVATLGTLRTLTNSVLQAAGVFVLPVVPDLSRYAASMECGKASATISALWLISTAPLCAGVSSLAPFAEPVYKWWTRDALTFSAVLFMLLAIGVLVRQWQTPMALFLFSANRLRAQLIVSVVRTVMLLACVILGFSMSGDIAVAGFAVLCSELAGAIAVVVFASAFLQEIGGSLPLSTAALAGGQVGITAAGGCLWIADAVPAPLTLAVCLCAHVIIAFAQWRMLPVTVRERLISVRRRENSQEITS